MRLTPFATAILTVFLSCHAQGAPDTGQRPYKIGLWPAIVFKGDKSWTLDERMRHYGVPGVSIALIKDFKVGWARNYGLADRRTGEPMTRNTLFQAGSISKPVAAFAALQMVEAGQLDLDADVNATLKTWKLPGNEFTADNKVTLRQLLSHTGGLTVHGFWGYPHEQALSEYWTNSSGLGKLGENIEFATAPLRINTLLYPDSANSWDSLGKAGQKNKAIESYKAALQRDPDLYSARMALKELTGK